MRAAIDFYEMTGDSGEKKNFEAEHVPLFGIGVRISNEYVPPPPEKTFELGSGENPRILCRGRGL